MAQPKKKATSQFSLLIAYKRKREKSFLFQKHKKEVKIFKKRVFHKKIRARPSTESS